MDDSQDLAGALHRALGMRSADDGARAPEKAMPNEDMTVTLRLRMRPIRRSDYHHNFLELLSQLSTVGHLSEESFEKRLQEYDADPLQHILVVEDLDGHRNCATGSVVIEPKFIHQAGLAGHLEDIVVDSGLRRKGLGRKLVDALMKLAHAAGCYKVIVDCAEHNVGFYETCGFKRKEVQMAIYFAHCEQVFLPRRHASLEDALTARRTEDNLLIRPLAEADYHSNFLKLLAQLTEVGHIEEAFFKERMEHVRRSRNAHVMVFEDPETGRIVATGSLLLERKFIHSGGLAGHIEDIVVDSETRGKGLGKRIVELLKEIALAAGCYKVILDCDQKNVAFYEKCGLVTKGVEMAYYFPAPLIPAASPGINPAMVATPTPVAGRKASL